MNFFDDMAAMCRTKLTAAGYAPDPANTPDDDVLDYLRVARRRIEARPRQVHVAPELVCPPELQVGFDAVTSAARTGQPLRPYQSKRVADAAYEDAMLNAWDIHHFHLGAGIEANGWAQRTGPLLFARVTETGVYCLAILGHGAWTQQELVATVHRNWPDTLADFRVKEAQSLEHTLSDDDVKRVRAANINAFIEVEPGVIYAPPGHGSTTDGTSMWVSLNRMNLRRACNDLERTVTEQLRDPASPIGAVLAAEGIDPATADFELAFRGEEVLLVETATRLGISIDVKLAAPPLG